MRGHLGAGRSQGGRLRPEAGARSARGLCRRSRNPRARLWQRHRSPRRSSRHRQRTAPDHGGTRELHPPDELGDGLAVLIVHHRHHRGVVTEEELVFLSRAVTAPVPPCGLGISRGAVGLCRRAGEARDVGPVDRVARKGASEAAGDARLDKRVAQGLEQMRRLCESVAHERSGVLDLAIGEVMQTGPLRRDDPEASLVDRLEATKGGADARQVGSGGLGGSKACRARACGASTAGAARRSKGASPPRRARRRHTARRAVPRGGRGSSPPLSTKEGDGVLLAQRLEPATRSPGAACRRSPPRP